MCPRHCSRRPVPRDPRPNPREGQRIRRSMLMLRRSGSPKPQAGPRAAESSEGAQRMAQGSSSEVDVVVVGAGIAGMYMLHKLRKAGLSTRVFEAGDNVGGTWYWNRYPGARVDIDAADYSYSFDPDLQQDWTWSEKCPTQPELLRYLNHVADRLDLRKDITFDTRVSSAV